MPENNGAVRPPPSTQPVRSRARDGADVFGVGAAKSLGPAQCSQAADDQENLDLTRTADMLVRQFESLYEGPRVFHHVVRLGDTAVLPLEYFVRGPSQAIYQTRSLAVDALAAIGTPFAIQALTRALRDCIARDPEPVSLEAEGVLVNHIAEHLSSFRSEDITEALLSAVQRRSYPYVAAALGLIGDHRAIPLLVGCLYDDPARPAAVGALRRFGDEALAQLTLAALCPEGLAGHESPTHVLARAAAVSLIGGCSDCEGARRLEALGRAIGDREEAVRWEAAVALATNAGSYAAETLNVLVAALGCRNWAQVQVAAESLVRLPGAGARIVRTICARPRTDEERRRQLRAVGLAGKMDLSDALPGLRALANAADPSLRLAAVSALGHIESSSADAIARFLTDREPIIRQRALQALRRQHALNPESATVFLGDEDPDVRRLADASVRENLETAWPALRRAVFLFGTPLHGFVSRLRLWWHASALVLSRENRRRHGQSRKAARRCTTSRPSDRFR